MNTMFAKRVRAVSIGAAISVLGAFAGVGSAQAAVYSGNWDPAYGGMFPNLGWKASATFDAPASCLGQADGSYNTGIGSPCHLRIQRGRASDRAS